MHSNDQLRAPFSLLPLEDLALKFGSQPKRTEGYYLLWIRQATGTLQLDYYQLPLQENMLPMVNQHRVLHAQFTQAAGFVLFFTEHFLPLSSLDVSKGFESILYHYFCHIPYICLPPTHLSKVETAFQELLEEAGQADRQDELLRSYVKILLLHYQRLMKQAMKEHTTEEKFDRIIGLKRDIEQCYKRHKDTFFYANKQDLTPKRLNELSRQALGKTITQLLHERLVVEAKRMLHFTDLSVKEIAFELGFTDPAYFYRFFKREVDLTPEQFRYQQQQTPTFILD